MKVIDNFLSTKDFKAISDEILGASFTWTYWHRVSDANDKHDNCNSKFTHVAFVDIQLTSAVQVLTKFITDERLDCKAMKRIIINSYPWTPTVYEHGVHEDYMFPHKGALLNLTTCDGYTVIEDEKIPSQNGSFCSRNNFAEHASWWRRGHARNRVVYEPRNASEQPQ